MSGAVVPLGGVPVRFAVCADEGPITVYGYGVNFDGDGFGKHGDGEPWPTLALAEAMCVFWRGEGIECHAQAVQWTADADQVWSWARRFGLEAALSLDS